MAGQFFTDEEVAEMEGMDAPPPVDVPPVESPSAPPPGGEGKRYFSDEEVDKIAAGPPDVSKLESFGQGTAQGASFGFSDEAAGVGALAQQIAPEFMGGMPSEKGDARGFWQKVSEAYKSGRDDERKNISAAQKANPGTFLAGNITGGMVATAPLMASGGAGTTLAKIPGMTRAAVPLATASKMFKPAKYLHQLANKSNTIWGATKLGAGMGGAAGLGSTAEISDPVQAAIDTAKGIGFGAAAGGLLTAGMKSIAAIPRWASARGKEVKRIAEESAEHMNKAATHADEVADDLLTASERVRKQVTQKLDDAGTMADDLPDAKPPKGWRPEPGTKAKKAAKFKEGAKEYEKLQRGQAAHDVEYVLQRRKQGVDITSDDLPSLDTQNPNNVYNKLRRGIDKYGDELDAYEEVTNDILMKSEARTPRHKVIELFEAEIAKARTETGTHGASRIERTLQKYIEGWPDQGVMGLAHEGKYMPADRMRTFLRGLRADRKNMYVAGKDLGPEELALKRIANELKKRIEKTISNKSRGLGDEYTAAMKEYAERMSAWSELKKYWKLTRTIDDVTGKPTWRPEAKNWFDTYFVHPIQKVETGERFANDSMMRAIQKFGDVTGDNYFQIVKDQQVFGRLFPAEAMGLQRGTWTAVTGRGASAIVNAGMGRLKHGVKEAAASVGEASAGVKENLFRKLVMEEGVPMSAELLETGAKVAQFGSEVAKGLGKTASGTAKVVETVGAPFGPAGDIINAAAGPVGRGYAVGKVLSREQRQRALEDARKRGGNAEASTAYVLEQIDPEFREERVNP